MRYNVGDKLCNCTLLQKCGYGSYGEVWLAEDAIGTRVALKILQDKYSEREVAGLKRYKDCNHPNLLKIRYVEINDDVICYTMDAADDLNCGKGDYLPDSLSNRLNKFGRLDGKEINAMVEDLLSGLEELHKRGLVHRDIKPDNILWVNGRATLADVGLIANDGANSLAGTLGFLSPRVLEGKPAESCDDFYALGKVIYCAMTGLAAKKYPSLPANMTISVDANLNRAVRESCTKPIHSTAEFRELLNQKKTAPSGQQPQLAFKVKLLIALLFIIAGILFYLFKQPEEQKVTKTVPQTPERMENTQPLRVDAEAEKRSEALQNTEADLQKDPLEKVQHTEKRKHIVQPVERDIEGEKRSEALQNTEADFQKALQATVLNIFEKSKWLSNNRMLPFLVNYQVMTREEMQDLLFSSNRNPRLVPTAGVHRKTVKSPTRLEQTLFSMLMDYHPDFAVAMVKTHQRYWQKQGDIKAMLTSDPVMQAVALDAIIRHGINTVLKRGSFQGSEQVELADLLSIRRALLDPEWGKLQYISKKILPQNR